MPPLFAHNSTIPQNRQASVRRAGFKKLVFVNSHGGQIAALAVAARRLRIEQGLLVRPEIVSKPL